MAKTYVVNPSTELTSISVVGFNVPLVTEDSSFLVAPFWFGGNMQDGELALFNTSDLSLA